MSARSANAAPGAQHRLSRAELRNGLALALVIFFRIVGLFMLVPILALYVDELTGATPLLIGIAVGIYGLTQAIFQMPMGAWSDRFGRKPVIVGGLVLFAAGSLVAAMSDHIALVILGRALQGMGAISSAVLEMAPMPCRAWGPSPAPCWRSRRISPASPSAPRSTRSSASPSARPLWSG